MDDVLIVGAGPTGLVLALWLTAQGIRVRIIDKSAGPGETSRAMAVQARTLELYRQIGIAEPVIAAGHKNPAVNMWALGKRKAHLALGDAGATLSPYPFVLIYPQDQHERLLEQRLLEMGVKVERETELLSFEDRGEHIDARLRLPGGGEQVLQARYLAGCDGARSLVRHQLGAGFEGGTYKQVFYVADVDIKDMQPRGEIHIALENGDFVLLLAYGEGDQYRLIGTVRDERAEHPEHLTFDDVGHKALHSLGVTVDKVNWFSTYRVHHRVADVFRDKRAFLLGDAAHVHSPAGGQGMNTGILDAINLAWKLAAVLKGQAADSLLDSYQAERQAFARRLVDTTDRLFSFVTTEGNFADFVKTRIAPALMGVAYQVDTVRELMFRTISQTMLHYRASPLSEGAAGEVQGGDRLPWTGAIAGAPDNYAALPAIGWQVQVYGTATTALKAACERHAIALREFAWSDDYRHAGLARDAAYLLRPDSYVALADPQGWSETLERYLASRALTLTRELGVAA